MEQNKCKSCGRQLPDKYSHKKCENCRNRDAKRLKDVGKAALGAGIIICGTVISVATNGKINFNKKN